MEKLYYIEALLTGKGIQTRTRMVTKETREEIYSRYVLYDRENYKHIKSENIGKVSLELKSTQVRAIVYAWETEIEAAKLALAKRLSEHVEKKIKDMQKMLSLATVDNITVNIIE